MENLTIHLSYHPPPESYEHNTVPPTYYSPRPRHPQYVVNHNIMERPRYISNAANFRTGKTYVQTGLFER